MTELEKLQRQHAWETEGRPELLRRRLAAKDAAEKAGHGIVLGPDLPHAVPAWWNRSDGVVTEETATVDRAGLFGRTLRRDGNYEVELPEGIFASHDALGRPYAEATRQLTPEETLRRDARVSKAEKVIGGVADRLAAIYREKSGA